MKLFIFAPSPNSLRVQALANHVGIELELINVDLPGGQQQAELAEINPNHKIPTLLDGDFALWESNAIMLYLAGKKPEAGLIPDDLQQQAKMHQWLSWNTAHFSQACGGILFENLVKKMLMGEDPDPTALAKATDEFHRYAGVLDKHLANNTYLLGDNMCVADHAVGSFLVHAEGAGIPLGDYANVKNWWGGIVSSEAWQKALQVIPQD